MLRKFKKLILVAVFMNHSFGCGVDRAEYRKKIYTTISGSFVGVPEGEAAATLASIDMSKFGPENTLPLVYASSQPSFGNHETVEFLLDHGHHVDQHNPDNLTALHAAVFGFSKKNVKVLLAHDARIDISAKIDLDGIGEKDMTAVELACAFKQISLKIKMNPNDCKKIGQIAKILKTKRDGAPDEPLY